MIWFYDETNDPMTSFNLNFNKTIIKPTNVIFSANQKLKTKSVITLILYGSIVFYYSI